MADETIGRELAAMRASIRERREKHMAELLACYRGVREAVAKVLTMGEDIGRFRAGVVETMGNDPDEEPVRRCFLEAIDDEVSGRPPRERASMTWLLTEIRPDPIDEGPHA